MNELDMTETPRKSRSLFHYTTAHGLLGIIKDRCLFATHASFLNDSSECRLVFPYVLKVVAAEYEQLYRKLVELKVMRAGLECLSEEFLNHMNHM